MAYYSVDGFFEGRGDTDWYRVYLEGGQAYHLSADGSSGATLATLRTVAGDPIIDAYDTTYIAQSGWYFVEASAFGNAPTSLYTVSLEAAPDDGYIASALTSHTIKLNTSVTVERTTDSAYHDDDWFGFDATAGKTYQFSGQYLDGPQAIHLHVYNANGVEVSDTGHFSAATSGRYFVGVDRDFVSSYYLVMRGVADDYGETIATTGVATVGGTVSAQFEGSGDHDWFRMELVAGHSYLLSGPQGVFGVADATGAVVKPWAEGANLFSVQTTGTYYLTAEDFRTQAPVGYQVTVRDVANEFADNASTRGSIVANGAAVNGAFETPNDIDWLAVRAEAGVSYQFATSTPGVTFRAYDGAGHQLTNDYAGSFTAAATGTYYLAVRPGYSVPPTYQVSVASYADDFAGGTSTTGRAVLHAPITGHLETANDTDWFAIDLQAGVTYIAGDRYNGARFYDASAALVSGTNDGNTFTPLISGTYYLEVWAGPTDYTVFVTIAPEDVAGNAATTAEMPMVWNGTAADDRFAGGEHADWLIGDAGNDRLYGLGGDDRLDGGDGNDLLTGGAGNDRLDGGAGVNRLIGEDGDDELSAFAGSATLTGGNGDDTYRIGAGVHVTVIEKAGGGIDTIRTDAPSLTMRSEVENLEGWAEGTGQTLTGNTLANRITGYNNNDILDGGAASDTLYGNGGSDRLIGGDGADTLFGGSGDDLIRGGTGSDVLSGGTGADRFLFIPGDLGVSGDRILDFHQTEGDRMDLSGYGALSFIGTAAFSGAAGQLRYTPGATTVVQADLNGDRVADFAIRLDGQVALARASFVLAAGAEPIEHDLPFASAHAGHLPFDLVHVALV